MVCLSLCDFVVKRLKCFVVRIRDEFLATEKARNLRLNAAELIPWKTKWNQIRIQQSRFNIADRFENVRNDPKCRWQWKPPSDARPLSCSLNFSHRHHGLCYRMNEVSVKTIIWYILLPKTPELALRLKSRFARQFYVHIFAQQCDFNFISPSFLLWWLLK